MSQLLDMFKNDNKNDTIISNIDSMGLNYKINNNLIIIKYPKKLKHSDKNYIRNSRGIIVDLNTKKIINSSICGAITYDKFKKNNNWNNVVIEECIDGTLINLFFYKDSWRLSTKFCIDANNSKFRSNDSFYKLFNDIVDIKTIDFDTKFTYSFVLVHEKNRNITPVYNNTIYHIESTNNLTGERVNIDLGFLKPKIFKFSNIINTFNINSYEELENFKFKSWKNPGFMIYNSDRSERTKINNSLFKEIENLIKNQNNFKFIFLKNLNNSDNIQKLLECYPEHKQLYLDLYNLFTTIIMEVHSLYIKIRVNKINNIKVNKKYKKILYNLHGLYLNKIKKNTNFKITLKDVRDILLNYDTAYLYSTYFN
jgi:hypothetical protein